MSKFKQFEKYISDNSPTILTSASVVGIVSTAVLSARAGYKAHEIINSREYSIYAFSTDPKERLKEEIQATWKLYIPTVGVGAAAITSVIFANRIGNRRTAAMAAAFTISEKAFDEYRSKVVEKIGEKKERAVRDEIAQDRVNATSSVIVVGDEGVLCYDSYTDRYFKSTMENLKQAQNNLNYKVLNNFSASLTEFYDEIGLPATAISDDVGWNSDKLLELDFTTVMSPTNTPCISVSFGVKPIRNYWSSH